MLVEGHPRNISEKLFLNRSRCRLLKGFFIFSSVSHFVYRSGTILANLVRSQLGIIHVKSKSKWPKGLGGVSIYSKLFDFHFFALAAILFIVAKPF